jgi:hypothetical protein
MITFALALMIVSEAATLARIEPFWSWNTPIAWTGFILFADAIVWRARHDSWIGAAGIRMAGDRISVSPRSPSNASPCTCSSAIVAHARGTTTHLGRTIAL